MKKTILFYLALALMSAMIFTRCNQGDGGSAGNHSQKKDTTFCLGIYKSDSVNVEFGQMRRVVGEALLPSTKDSMKNEWRKDTFYLIVKRVPVDSAISNEYFKQRGIRINPKDSTGKQNFLPFEYVYNKKFVRDGWSNLDSSIEYLKKVKL